MDDKDKKLLQLLSNSFPIAKKPLSEIGSILGIDEKEILEHLRNLKASGVIRRIGATIDPRKIGWYSTLCCADIPDDKITEYTSTVNSFIEVTHNYIRSGNPNCWFTIIAPDKKRCDEIISQIETCMKIKVKSLEAKRIFKIGVSFSF